MGVRWRQGEDGGKYGAYLAGKRVVIVGPAASLTGRGLGPEIDSYDVVVRLNLASPVPEELKSDIGSRTDVLYHVLLDKRHANVLGRDHSRSETQAWRNDGVKWLVTRQQPGHERIRRIRPHLGTMPLITMPPRLLADVRLATGVTPNTGTLAIAHLLSLGVASLHVTGFDFYATGYYVGYGGFDEAQAALGVKAYGSWSQGPYTRQPHPQEVQMRYLAELSRSDQRLTFDEIASARLGLVPDGEQIVALVPMKDHSERVPGKNIRDLCGKPLLYYVLDTLHRSRRINGVVVDTDSEVIAALVRQHHPRTEILMRPAELRGDLVTANDLIKWDMTQVEGEHFGQFHATSPLLTPETVDRIVAAYFDSPEHDSLMTVTEHHFWLFRADGTPINSDTGKLVRSQDLEPLFEDNSAAHLFSRSSFAATGSRIGERVQMFPMSKVEAIDIDYEEDFVLAEAVMRSRQVTEIRKPRNPYEKRRAA